MEGHSVSYLDREVWRQLVEADTVGDFCSHWLKLQCLMLRGVQSATVLAQAPHDAAETGSFEPVTYWPDKQTGVSDTLKRVAEQALESKQGVVSQGQGQEQSSGIGYPVWIGGVLKAVVVLEVAQRSEEELRAVLRTLQWGASWLENFFLRQHAPDGQADAQSDLAQQRMQQLIDLLAQTLEQKDFSHACMVLVNELSSQFNCDRVSLGFKKRNQILVQTMSHSSQMDQKMNLVRAIGDAMDEVADQDATIHYPHDHHYLLITQAHAKLNGGQAGGNILSLPLKQDEDHVFAVLTMEYSKVQTDFSANDIVFCEAMAALLGPVLYAMQNNNSPLWRKAADSWRRQWSKLIGEEYLLRKFMLAGLIAVSLFLFFSTDEYRVSAESVIEGQMRRVITAPFDGYIKEAFVRVGDTLKQGQSIVTLDDDDLRLERLKWVAKKGEYSHRRQQAQADHDLGESRLARVQQAQADAELELVNERIKRTRIVAPFDGLIVDGDLSQSLGSVVQKGEVLFEMTPLNAYRIKLKVSETEITVIRNQQQGKLYLTSIPGQTFAFQVQRITPISTARDGINYFTVEASLDTPTDALRPGMEGVGKISIGERNIFWIWTHELFDWLRLKLWSVFGLNV